MENIQEHTIQFTSPSVPKNMPTPPPFIPAEGLNNNGTKVEVLDPKKANVIERATLLHPPWSATTPSDDQIDWSIEHNKKIEEVRSDPGYQFIMKVAGFTNRNIKKLVNVPNSRNVRRTIPEPLSNAYVGPVPPENDDAKTNWHKSHEQYKWLSIPEISGVVHLSSVLYGHITEARDILERKVGQRFVLKGLVEGYVSTLFARLVGIRIHLSQFLSGVNYQLDRTYNRLHREQHLVLRSLRSELGSNGGGSVVTYATWLKDKEIYNIGRLNGNIIPLKNRYRGLY